MYWDFDFKPHRFTTHQKRFQMRIYYEGLLEFRSEMHIKDTRIKRIDKELRAVRKWIKENRC